jgi:hypothetical protein
LPSDACVPLARYTASSSTLDLVNRPLVYGNRLLYQLIYCLAERVSQVAGAHLLLYESGDGQTAAAGSNLPQPLVVRLTDAANNPIEGAAVQFDITGGGGATSAVTEPAPGRYEITWQVGAAGPQTIVAKAAGTALTVTLHATAT